MMLWSRALLGLRALPRLNYLLPKVGFRPIITPATARCRTLANQSRWFADSSSSKQASIVVPSLGDSITEGEVVEVLKGDGTFVNIDDVVAVLETDKVSVDIRSPHTGTITSVKCKPGQTVKIGEVLFTIDTDPDSTSRDHPSSPPPPESPAAKLTHVAAQPSSENSHAEAAHTQPSSNLVALRSPYQPTIQFRYGVREKASAARHEQAAPSVESPASFPWVPTPARYRRLPVSQAEIEAIESGGIFGLKSMYA